MSILSFRKFTPHARRNLTHRVSLRLTVRSSQVRTYYMLTSFGQTKPVPDAIVWSLYYAMLCSLKLKREIVAPKMFTIEQKYCKKQNQKLSNQLLRI